MQMNVNMSADNTTNTSSVIKPIDLSEDNELLREMSSFNKITTLTIVVIPFLATIYGLCSGFASSLDFGLLSMMYFITAVGITTGYHRLLTHCAFDTSRIMKYLFAICGTMAAQGSVLTWVSDHRKHHRLTDREGDPHSPHLHEDHGFWASMKGLYHAHMGWLLQDRELSDWRIYAKDLYKDEGMRIISRNSGLIFLAGLLIPTILGGILSSSVKGALSGFLWGGLIRIFLGHHVTWSINSICHFHGFRDFRTKDYSTNVPWLSLISFGESWHNNHHAFPRSAEHGMKWWQIDISHYIISALEKLGLVWNVVRYSDIEKDKKRVRAFSLTPLRGV